MQNVACKKGYGMHKALLHTVTSKSHIKSCLSVYCKSWVLLGDSESIKIFLFRRGRREGEPLTLLYLSCRRHQGQLLVRWGANMLQRSNMICNNNGDSTHFYCWFTLTILTSLVSRQLISVKKRLKPTECYLPSPKEQTNQKIKVSNQLLNIVKHLQAKEPNNSSKRPNKISYFITIL